MNNFDVGEIFDCKTSSIAVKPLMFECIGGDGKHIYLKNIFKKII